MAEKQEEFSNISDLLKTAAESVEEENKQQDETKNPAEEQIDDIFTDFDFDEDEDDDEDLEDIIPFEEAQFLSDRKKEIPHWLIITILIIVTVFSLIFSYFYGLKPLLYNYFFNSAIKQLQVDKDYSLPLNLTVAFAENPAEANLNFARECWKLHKFEEVKLYLNEAKKEDKDIIYSNNYKDLQTKLLIAKGNFLKAEEILKYNNKASFSKFNRGEIELRRGNYKKAIEFFKDVVRLKSNDPAAYIKLRRLYLKLKDYDNALRIQKNLQSIDNAPPLDAEAYSVLGQVFVYKKNYDKALEFFAESIKLNSEVPFVYLQLAEIYKTRPKNTKIWIEKDYKNAIKNYKEYLKRIAKDAKVYSIVGQLYYYLGNIKQAVLNLKQSIDIDPNLPETHYYIANIYAYEFNTYDEAIKEYNLAKKYGLNKPIIDFNIGYSNYYLNNYKESSIYFEKLLNSDFFDDFQKYVITKNLSLSYLFEKKYNKSINNFDIVLKKYNKFLKQKFYLLNNLAVSWELKSKTENIRKRKNSEKKAANYYWTSIESQEKFLDKSEDVSNKDILINKFLKTRKNFKRFLKNRNIQNIKDSVYYKLETIETLPIKK